MPYRYTILLMVIASSCMVGVRVQNDVTAYHPAGEAIRVNVTRSHTVLGELLAVSDTALFVLVDRRVTLFRFRDVRSIVSERGTWWLGADATRNDRSATRFRLVSRYPQGIDADLLPRLLDAYGQASVDVYDVTSVPSMASFIEKVKASTISYHNVATAIADGFRRIGPPSPSMGQHWIHPQRVLDPTFESSQPEILTYATIKGHATLVGVGYAIPLEKGEQPPSIPAGLSHWHVHNGNLTAEALATEHNMVSTSDFRVAVLHAWVWRDNPDGLFAPDNWALPFDRAGLRLPQAYHRDVPRALALASESGRAYLIAQSVQISSSSRDAASVSDAVHRVGQRVADFLESRADGPLAEEEMSWLSNQWGEIAIALGAQSEGVASRR